MGTELSKSRSTFRLLLGWSTGSFVVLFALGNLAIGAGALLGSFYRWVASSPWHLVPSIAVVIGAMLVLVWNAASWGLVLPLLVVRALDTGAHHSGA